jgi:flagellar basal body P-ring protein FlgI
MVPDLLIDPVSGTVSLALAQGAEQKNGNGKSGKKTSEVVAQEDTGGKKHQKAAINNNVQSGHA